MKVPAAVPLFIAVSMKGLAPPFASVSFPSCITRPPLR